MEDWTSFAQADVLGDEVICAGDPSYAACAALLPELAGYTFLATEESPEVFGVDSEGRIGLLGTQWGAKPLERVLFDPRAYLPPNTPTAHKLARCSFAGTDHLFLDPVAGLRWNQKAFACSGEKPGTTSVLVALILGDPYGEPELLSFRVTPESVVPIDFNEFSALCFADAERWREVFRGPMALELPEAQIQEASLASLARAFTTYDGDHPHYGVGHYRASAHDGFPPTTISMVNACVEWNLLGRARRYLDYYLDHFLRPDGTFDYYGPAISEYGQMLDVIARYVRRSGDGTWLRERVPAIESLVNHLLRLRRESQERLPKDDVRHGLLRGSPEADTRDEVDYYYSGNTWAWRGWTEIARAFIELGDDPMRERGRELLAECDAFRADIEAGLSRSVIDTPEPFLPPVAGFDKPFASMTQDRFASYTNYRYWPEMLSSGLLRSQWAYAIINYRRQHGGEILGMTRFEDRLDNWPYAGYASGLLQLDLDEARPFLLGFYGDLACHRQRGTFTAYEQAHFRGSPTRSYAADYCVPAQLVTPLMAKWMLVFEEPDADILWLCRAAPGRWLEPSRRVGVRRATTRWGPVEFEITPERRSTAATLWLPRENFPAEIRLRLRTFSEGKIRTATVNGAALAETDFGWDFVRIVRPQSDTLEVKVMYD